MAKQDVYYKPTPVNPFVNIAIPVYKVKNIFSIQFFNLM